MNPSPIVVPSLVTAGAVIGGKYRLVERLGEGGIAEVWEAVNVDLDAPVAVKVCRPNTSDPTSVQRLIREARAAARLMHPSIVRIYDTGLTEQGAPYVVMERLQGVNLRVEIDREGPIDLLYIVSTMIAVADALELAHRHGVVHRDVKPDNIFLAAVDAGRVQPKLLDFGIIKIEGYSANLTKTGTTLGSPAYMAPEQAAGEADVDARADVWSACVVLFEAMTGTLPFEAANYNALMRSILADPVPDVVAALEKMAALTPFSAAVARVVQRGLTKERAGRWQTAAELRDALSECVQLVLPKESASQGSITAYHLVRTSTVPKDAATLNQWSGAHASVRETKVSTRWWAAVAALVLVGGALAGLLTWRGAANAKSAAPTTAREPVSVTGERTSEPTQVSVLSVAASSSAVMPPNAVIPPNGAVPPNGASAGTTDSPRAVTHVPHKHRSTRGPQPTKKVPRAPSDELGLKEAY